MWEREDGIVVEACPSFDEAQRLSIEPQTVNTGRVEELVAIWVTVYFVAWCASVWDVYVIALFYCKRLSELSIRVPVA